MTVIDKNVFNTVTSTLRKITFGAIPAKPVTDDCLVMMNVPSLMAQRDSAYDWATYLIKYLFNVPVDKRVQLYDAALELLDSSIDSCESIILMGDVSGGEDVDFMSKYLVMLRDVVRAASVLAGYESSFIGERLGKDRSNSVSEPEAHLIEENFRNCEQSIYKSMIAQIEMAEPLMRRHRESHVRSLSKDGQLRYEKSFQEFDRNYGEYGKSFFPEK